MDLDPKLIAEFREQLRQACDADEEGWRESRRCVHPLVVGSTLNRLQGSIQTSELSPILRDLLSKCLHERAASAQPHPHHDELLKRITGLPPTKALRALCVFWGLTKQEDIAGVPPLPNVDEIVQCLRRHSNPFDLLLKTAHATVLDLGAGDLSFASDLIDRYLPRLQAREITLTLHCIDRLHPGSRLGGPLHPDQRILENLRSQSRRCPSGLQFKIWRDQDMFALEGVKGILPVYTIVSCYAPATPTFAYEPTRVSWPVIEKHLQATKGVFRRVRVHGEEALEVLHRERSLLFPPWKFDIRGPLALLDLISRRGTLCVLAAIDSQVFWEIVSQLLADPRFRPPDVIWDRPALSDVFGSVYTALSSLSVGSAVSLSDVADLRSSIPRVLHRAAGDEAHYSFRYVEVRRGAVFEGIPASRTAHLFSNMAEEEPPWFMILVPERSKPAQIDADAPAC